MQVLGCVQETQSMLYLKMCFFYICNSFYNSLKWCKLKIAALSMDISAINFFLYIIIKMQILPNYLFLKFSCNQPFCNIHFKLSKQKKILYRKKTQSILPPRGKNCLQKKMSSPQFCRLNFTKFVKAKLLNFSFTWEYSI